MYKLFALAVSALMNKHSIKVEPTDKPREWELLENIEYAGVMVPAGFIFDGASIPVGLRWKFPHGGPKFFGACIHDWCYRTGCVSKETADGLFLAAMLENGTDKMDAKMMYLGVKYCGKFAWNKRRREQRERGRHHGM